MPETIHDIVTAHREGRVAPAQTVARSFARIRARGDDAIFISLRQERDAIAEAERLARRADAPALPLYGVPVAVKDNIDVAGLPTTAACPAYAYQPSRDAAVVARLRAAGAIVVGKTNLDQFATGLVGVRSPYGVPRNALRDDLVPGGSSSGSAVAVGAGLVPLALGTDTAGSGRVPAMLNNIVGLKPSLGMLPATGVVPACRSLDCVSIFALTTDDALAALSALAGPDAEDAYSRDRPLGPVVAPSEPRLGVPRADQRQFFADAAAAKAYEAALERLAASGARLVEIDMAPLYECAQLLYEGPWVAERYLVIRDLLAADPDAIHPVTRAITEKAKGISAADTFAAFYRLEALRAGARRLFATIDALVVPTAPTTYTVAEVLADPITLNSRLGAYTNFVNLLDLCGLAVPAALSDDKLPFGITFIAPAGADARLAALGRAFHAGTGLPLGGFGAKQPPLPVLSPLPRDEIAIAVVGAHLSGMALNHELTALGARLVGAATTAPLYRLHALNGTSPAKPGMLRVGAGGVAIAVEVWAVPAGTFGRFVAAVPPPLSIGTIELADGGAVKGFLVEASALEGARDISSFGGWRAFMETQG